MFEEAFITCLESDIIIFFLKAEWNRSKRLRPELEKWRGLSFCHPRYSAGTSGLGEGERKA